MDRVKWIGAIAFFALHIAAPAQTAMIRGSVASAEGRPIEFALVGIKENGQVAEPGADGLFSFQRLPYGTYTFVALALGKKTEEQQVVVAQAQLELHFKLEDLPDVVLDEVLVMEAQERALGIQRLHAVQQFTMFEGKKNEVVLLRNLAANTATNNARQIYGTVTGLNIWESDGGGLQLGIGGRGLSPNRSSNFNTRQNGYDISADALGYPESYYTPVAEALDRIEVIRGASGLQYGTQFGGTVNFHFKKGRRDVPFEYVGRQSAGSWNFLNSFHSIGGTVAGDKLNYYAFYQRKQGNGWRPNSAFGVHSAYAHLNFQWTPRTNVGIEYTHMDYVAQQPGGLTDAMFEQDPRQSVRNRNWFKVDWNLLAATLTHRFSLTTHLNIRTFGLLAGRQALGNLERINVVDFNQNRTLIDGRFRNLGGEARLVHRYRAGKQRNALLTGLRVYSGRTLARQGDAGSGSGPDFTFLNPDFVEGSDYAFPNYNYAAFAEHIFQLSDKLSITPGLRFEHIQTFSRGFYRQRVFDFAGNLIADRKTEEALDRKRSFVIAGVGVSYKANPQLELYSNISQNYRAINFTDLRIQNPNFVIDTSLTDEKGFTADLGIRGGAANVFQYELTAFFLYYNNRIGQILQADQPPLFLDYRLRTNVAASRNAGVESFASLNLARLLPGFSPHTDWTYFVNVATVDARYIKSRDAAIQHKKVEMAPPFILRSGTAFKKEKWRAGFQVNYVTQHFSDATNAVRTATAVEGLIPAYTVADISGGYRLNGWISLEFSCNNLFNAMYFTRRAEAYPGPGIIPGDGRSFFVTAQLSFATSGKRRAGE